MKSLHIRNLDDEVLFGLKKRAQRHHRSVQKEVEVLLRDAAEMIRFDPDSGGSPLQKLNVVETSREENSWSREEMYGHEGR